jgi:hypothetical protein
VVAADDLWTVQQIVAGIFEPQAAVRAVPALNRKPARNPCRLPCLPTIGSLAKSFAEGLGGLFEGFRQFLVATATAGGTMTRQGKDVAIGRLHPEFARRLAAAIEEARGSGLPHVAVYSAYRPPAFGVGGMRDKGASMHAYGLAVDVSGIGRPRSTSARLWARIAIRNGLYNPYLGTRREAWEWNHWQPTLVKSIPRHEPLRKTITARGPVSLEQMWRVANALIGVGKK